MPQLPEDKRAQLDSIVQRMVQAGESDDNIRAVVADFSQKYSAPQQTQPAQTTPAELPFSRIGKFVINAVKNNPATTGAIVGGTLAAPLTGGMSLLPTMATLGSASALGAGVGQVASGQQPDPERMAVEGALGMAGPGLVRAATPVVRAAVPALRGTLRLARGAPSAAIDAIGYLSPRTAQALRLLQRIGRATTPETGNAGGRLVRPPVQPTVEDAMTDALSELRAAPKPSSVSLPPAPQLPPGYKPRTTAPSPKPTAKPAPSAPKKADVIPEELPAAEGLSAFEQAAVDAELSARGLMPTIGADDAARYLREYGQLIPPGTRQARHAGYVQDALENQRYRFHLENPASAVALGAGGGLTFQDELVRLLGGGQPGGQ